jgi:TonB family protein
MFRSATPIATLCALLIVPGVAGQDGYLVIVNPSNAATALSKAQVSDIFLRRQVVWDDGRPVTPVDQTNAGVRETFSRDVLGMPATSAFSQAQEAAAAGRGEPPLSVATDREVLAFVRLKPGAIGYVSAGAPVHGVRVLSLDGRSSQSSREPVRVGGTVRPPTKIVDARPMYPAMARQARAEGTVQIEIVIGPAGNVEQARVIRSVPLLDRAALDAVRQWKYAPTIVNGVAVPVTIAVGVSFAL